MKRLLIALLLLASFLIAWGLGERQPAWGESPVVTPIMDVHLPLVMRNYDGTPMPTPTPVPLPKLQGVGVHRPDYVSNATYDCAMVTTLEVEWYYDWGPRPECPGAIPMIWDEAQVDMEIVWWDSEWLQVFCECDFSSQCNLSPAAAAVWYRYVESLYPGKLLVGPAVWHMDWLEDFWDYYELTYLESPKMDAVSIHLYPQLVSPYGSPSSLISISTARLNLAIDFAELHDIPEVWVTEFTAQPRYNGTAGSIAYMQGMVAVFEAEPLVTRWAWFGADLTGFWYWPSDPEMSAFYDTSLVHSGELTSLGTAYLETQ
jgi:hypothetical protein